MGLAKLAFVNSAVVRNNGGVTFSLSFARSPTQPAAPLVQQKPTSRGRRNPRNGPHAAAPAISALVPPRLVRFGVLFLRETSLLSSSSCPLPGYVADCRILCCTPPAPADSAG